MIKYPGMVRALPLQTICPPVVDIEPIDGIPAPRKSISTCFMPASSRNTFHRALAYNSSTIALKSAVFPSVMPGVTIVIPGVTGDLESYCPASDTPHFHWNSFVASYSVPALNNANPPLPSGIRPNWLAPAQKGS